MSRMFSSPYHPDQLWGLSVLQINEYGVLSLGVKGLGQGGDHSSQTSAEVKKTWRSAFTHPWTLTV
jgi:hypothetical protein